MSPLNTDDLHRIFKKLDKNGDGLVSLDELKWLLDRTGLHSCQDELQSLVGETGLDLIDFLSLYDSIANDDRNLEDEEEVEGKLESEASGRSGREEAGDDNKLDSDLVKAFEVYDLNGDGYISCEELQSVLSRLGLWHEHCGKDCRSMIKGYDTNSDGLLDFEEFKNMMLLTNP